LRWNTLTQNQRDPDLYDYETVNKESLFEYTPPSLDDLRNMSREEKINLSPAEKYDIMMGRYDYPTVASERARTSPGMQDWQGICHGWVPAAIDEPEPQPIDATNADGILVPFGSSDVKGLLSYYYGITAYDYARGQRMVARNGSVFEEQESVDSFDVGKWLNLAADALVINGRGYEITPTSLNDSAVCDDQATAAGYGSREKCLEAFSIPATVDSLDFVAQVGSRSAGSDPNPGAFHVIIANQIGLMKKAFAGNINKYLKAGQIWNQPVTGYASVVDSDNRQGRGGEVHVTTTLTYVSEIPQTYAAVVNTPIERTSTMAFGYTLEIDSYGNITGGSWDSRYHPSFLWTHGRIPVMGYFGKLNQLAQPRLY
jgi:hypothetical protein